MIVKRVLLLFLMVLMFSCQKDVKINHPTQTEIIKNVNSFLNDWHEAASEANFDNYFSKMDSISVFIGTDASENWTKKAFVKYSKPYFDKGKAWNFKTLERNVYVNSTANFIWFDELLETRMGICRGSGVIALHDAKLSIKHYVLSITIPNDDVDEVVNIKTKKDSKMIRKLKSEH